jgi:hypothetical protein
VPLLLQRLRRLQSSSEFAMTANNTRPFAHLSSLKSPPYRGDGVIKVTPPSGVKRQNIFAVRENGVTSAAKTNLKETPEVVNSSVTEMSEVSDLTRFVRIIFTSLVRSCQTLRTARREKEQNWITRRRRPFR